MNSQRASRQSVDRHDECIETTQAVLLPLLMGAPTGHLRSWGSKLPTHQG
jgi:hypothetical protein